MTVADYLEERRLFQGLPNTVLGKGTDGVVLPVYICAPYGASSDEEVTRNVTRAADLARYAVTCGLCPIVGHPLGRAGIYGGDGNDDGKPSRARHNAIACGMVSAAIVGGFGGLLWVVTRDDRSRSEGCSREVDQWYAAQEARRAVGGKPLSVYGLPSHAEDTWDGWVAHVRGLVGYSRSLAAGIYTAPPDTFAHGGAYRVGRR